MLTTATTTARGLLTPSPRLMPTTVTMDTVWPITDTDTVLTVRCLQERKVCAAENRLRLLKGVHLAVPCLLTRCEILDQPIALRMQRLYVLHRRHELLRSGSLLLLVRLEVALQRRLGFPLVGDRLRVIGALRG